MLMSVVLDAPGALECFFRLWTVQVTPENKVQCGFQATASCHIAAPVAASLEALCG
jgi:hypothetical protein